MRYYGAQIPGAMPVTTLTQNLAQIAVIILGGLILLDHFKVSITPILTALGDTETRQKLLAVTTDLRKCNFVEGTAENLSNGIRQIQPTHNAAEPRHAFNTFQFQIPSSLPDDGGPGELIDEVHSFGMVFTGFTTDFNTGLLLILMALVCWPKMPRAGAQAQKVKQPEGSAPSNRPAQVASFTA